MSSVSNKRKKRGRWQSGVTSLELALVMVPFFLMMLGTFDLVRYLYTEQALLTVMSEAGRFAMTVPRNQWQICGIGSWAETASLAPLLDAQQVNVCIGSVNTVGIVNQVQVTVQYPFTATTPLLSALDGTLTQTTIYSY
jgi:hypothetical protein